MLLMIQINYTLVKKATAVLGCINGSTGSEAREVMALPDFLDLNIHLGVSVFSVTNTVYMGYGSTREKVSERVRGLES